ncbi:serine/threonine-protein kinase ULK4-like isoform X3 [Pomacea canaliculata]|uniref:serine/threonine-protein kinase ULK4-like isoform X3 n=1 Tax=Pomacea canaliculata TaxID=400727 RepID=UPI000D7394E3|nr:serine/threonine-protein kinase ULK4-like isoform X3 [Pomacea canaliculata]
MENFVLYEELGKRDHAIIYKGRRKGSISFVAIHCIDKCKRPEVTNTVRMTHDISHPNVVQFHEWYETSNHLWLVVELCTGGSLADILTQDLYLPESSIRDFGLHLVTGLHYIHSLGILFHDLQPSKILMDSSGVLKYADFGLAKVEGENLEELFYKFADAGEQWNTQSVEEIVKQNSISGSPTYMSPELFQGGEPNIMTDLWALGCVFYEMFAGHPPFLGESKEILKEKVLNKEFPTPKVKGSRLSAKPSPEFLSLLENLLQKDPSRRLGWQGLVNHSFWQGKLSSLAKDFNMSQDTSGIATPASQSTVFEHNASSVLGRIKSLDFRRSIEKSVSRLDVVDSPHHLTFTGDVLRPKTAPGHDTGGSTLFTLSARPHTAVPPDDKVTSPYRQIQSPLTTREVIGGTQEDSGSFDKTSEGNVQKLIFHDSDFTASQIIDNPKIQKPVTAASKFDQKALPVPPFTGEKLNSMTEKELLKHIRAVIESIGSPEKGPPSQKRIHLLHYAASIASSMVVATAFVNTSALMVLAHQIRDCSNVDVRIKLGRVMALIAHFADSLDENVNMCEPLTLVTEVLRENVKNSKLKQGLLPAVGEMLCLVASQEQKNKEGPVEAWAVPSMVYTIITRSCRDGEDPVLNHIAAKIIETITASRGSHAEKFVTNEIGQALWYVYKHSTVDSLRITALSALCHVTWQNPLVFQSVIEVVGLSVVCQALTQGITRVQQAVVTMFGALVASSASISRLTQDKDFLLKIIRLLDSPSTIIRGKALVVIHQLVCRNTEMLLHACQNRLVMYVERDSRHTTPHGTLASGQEHDVVEYLGSCLHLLISGILVQVPIITREMLGSLDAVAGRRHPSAAQVRQLKSTLPLLAVFTHLVTSQVFRGHVVTEEFIKSYGQLMVHVRCIESGETNIESASVSLSVSEFVGSAVSILEGIAQHPTLLMEHQGKIIETILPELVALTGSQNVEVRARALNLLSEISSVLLSQAQFISPGIQDNTDSLLCLITDKLLPMYESLLLDPEPLPSAALALLLSLLEHRPALSRNMCSLGLLPVLFQIITDHHSKSLGRSVHSILGILNCLMNQRDAPMKELYELGLIDELTLVMQEMGHNCWAEAGDASGSHGTRESGQKISILQSALELMHNLLRQVSEVVRKALQLKKGGGGSGEGNKEAEEAEQLLLTNKPLTELTPLLTQLLCHEDSDIQELALKDLSLLVQLFGGESRDSLSQDSQNYYNKALSAAPPRKQKVLLRVIKRLLTTAQHHTESLKQYGTPLLGTIHSLVHTASSHADMALSTLAAEILKLGGKLT